MAGFQIVHMNSQRCTGAVGGKESSALQTRNGITGTEREESIRHFHSPYRPDLIYLPYSLLSFASYLEMPMKQNLLTEQGTVVRYTISFSQHEVKERSEESRISSLHQFTALLALV